MEQLEEVRDEVVDLGVASEETQSGGGRFVDLIGPTLQTGIADD